MTRPRIGIVLAAGKGTRLKSDLPKVLHPLLGKSLLQRVLEGLVPLGLQRVIVITGHQAEPVQAHVEGLQLPFPVSFVVQEPQLGTGHALMQILPELPEQDDVDILITCGDMPLIPSERYQTLLDTYTASDIAAALVTVSLPNPYGYGRIISQAGQFERIIEEKDASAAEKQIRQVNAGIYAAHWPRFAKYLSRLERNNAQGEFYLTDVMGMMAAAGADDAVSVVEWPEPDEVLGINSRHQLAEAGSILSAWTANRLMAEGVSLVNPESMTLAPEIEIGADTVLHPGCYLQGPVRIGSHCDIGPHTTMRGEIQIGDHCRIVQSYLDRAVRIDDNSYIGPFAHLRDNAILGKQVRVGNFVEVKETRVGDRSAAAHLCYLGDAVLGADVNMGAGSITANFDPIRNTKHQTIIRDGVKVGCNSVLIAPVTLETDSCVAAGSVITHNVASLDLAIARPKQTGIPGWVKTTREKTVQPAD